MHNNGDRAGAITLGAFGVLEEEEARDGDGVWHLLMEEDIKDPGELRCGVRCLIWLTLVPSSIRPSQPPLSPPSTTVRGKFTFCGTHFSS